MTQHQVRKARLAMQHQLREEEAKQAVIAAAVVYPDGGTVTGHRREYADGFTRFGRPGQCQSCGAFRLDGQPATVHRTKCVKGADGSALPPIYDPAPAAPTTVKEPLTPARHPARTRR